MDRRTWITRAALTGLTYTSLNPFSLGFNQKRDNKLQNSDSKLIRLYYNENPYGPSKRVLDAIEDASDISNRYATYSATDFNHLRDMIAKTEGLTREHVMLTHGSTEGLSWVGTHFSEMGKQLITPTPSFDVVGWIGKRMKAKVIQVGLDSSFQYDFDKIHSMVGANTGIVTFCSPNNPTGKVADIPKLRKFIAALPAHTTALVDEAYIHYTGQNWREFSMINLLREGKSVIISRTFSKAYGLAGLRIGFLLAPPDIIKHFEYRFTFGFPGNAPNAVSVAAAIASIEDEEFLNETIRLNNSGKEEFYQAMKNVSADFVKSDANFVFVNVGNAEHFRTEMAKRGIMVANGLGAPPEFARISIGKTEEMNIFYSEMKDLLK